MTQNRETTPSRAATLFTLLESTSFADVLWARTHLESANPAEETLADLAATIAAQHLKLWAEATQYARAWSTRSGLHQTEGPLVSIVIPTYNRPETLTLALESVARQLYTSIEVVVVNDAGAPVTEALRPYQERLPLTLVTNSENSYLAASRNIGAKHAAGQWVLFLDDDDQLYPHHVGHLVHLLTHHGTRAAQALSFRHKESTHAPFRSALVPHVRTPFELENLLLENVTPVQAVLCETALFRSLGGFDESLFACEDWDLWIRLRHQTPVTESPIITSLIENREANDRMSTHNRAPFLLARSKIYNRYAHLLPPSPTSPHRLQQECTLTTLATTLQAEMKRLYSLEVVHHAPSPQRAPEWLSHFQPGSCLTLTSTNWLQADLSLEGLREATVALLRSRGDFVAIVEPGALEDLPESWTTTLMIHLAGDRTLAGATPSDLPASESGALERGQSSDAPPSDPKCVMIRKSFLPRLNDYVNGLEEPTSLYQALRDCAALFERRVVAASDVSAHSTHTDSTSGRLPCETSLERHPHPPPLLHITYSEETFTSAGMNSSPPLLLQDHLSFYKEAFNLVKPGAPPPSSRVIDRRPGLFLEFEFGQNSMETLLQPCLAHANLSEEKLILSSPGEDVSLPCDLHLHAEADPAPVLRERLNKILENQFPNRSFHPPTRAQLPSVVLVAPTSPNETITTLDNAVSQLRNACPGVDLTLLTNSPRAHTPLATRLDLRLLPTLDSWLHPLSNVGHSTDVQRLKHFFEFARKLTFVHHYALPTLAPVGLPKNIYQSLWWTSRAQSLVFLDFPQYGDAQETTAFFGACLLSTLAQNHKVEMQRKRPPNLRPHLEALSEKIRGAHTISPIASPEVETDEPSPLLCPPLVASPSAQTSSPPRVLLPLQESAFTETSPPPDGALVVLRPSPPSASRDPSITSPAWTSKSHPLSEEFSKALYLIGALAPGEVNLTHLQEPHKSVWTSVCQFTATRVTHGVPG